MRPGTVIKALCSRPMQSLGYELRTQMRQATEQIGCDYWLERQFELAERWLGRLSLRSIWLIEDMLDAKARRP